MCRVFLLGILSQSMADFTPKTSQVPGSGQSADLWSNKGEGKLSVDVLDLGQEIVVIAPMAGAKQEAIEISVYNDIITIRGERHLPDLKNMAPEFIHTECYWGPFSRTIVLPAEVKSEQSRAEYRNGVLVVRVPKRATNAKIPVKIIEE